MVPNTVEIVRATIVIAETVTATVCPTAWIATVIAMAFPTARTDGRTTLATDQGI
jgi:hypothetical protein